MTVLLLLLRKYWRPLLLVALGLAAAAACYRSGYKAGSAAVQTQWSEAKKAAAEAVAQAKDQDLSKGQQASAQYQAERTKHAERIRVVRQEIVRTVTGPCLDDGVREQINAAIGGVSAPAAAR